MNKKDSKKRASGERLSVLFHIAGEMLHENGEDSYYCANRGNKTIVSVFDGCGGIGSRRYGNYSGKTGAYVASRAVCGSIRTWFKKENTDFDTVKNTVDRAMKICDSYVEKGGKMIGSLGKSFPTTAAIAVATDSQNGVDVTCMWVGDSRCYLLNNKGLHQLTIDDVEGEDAFTNLYDDGVLNNVITANCAFSINRKSVKIKYPVILFSATDGCFGYVNTPMEFEYLILESLIESDNIGQWKNTLNQKIREFTGDDYTMCVAAFGFDNFESMKKYYKSRKDSVEKMFIKSEKTDEEKWSLYKTEYYAL